MARSRKWPVRVHGTVVHGAVPLPRCPPHSAVPGTLNSRTPLSSHSKQTESPAQHSQPIPPANRVPQGLSPDPLTRLSSHRSRRGAMHPQAAQPGCRTCETYRKTSTILTINTNGPQSPTGSVPRCTHPPEHSSRCHAPMVAFVVVPCTSERPCLDATHSKHTERPAQYSQSIPTAHRVQRGLSPDALTRLSIRRGATHLWSLVVAVPCTLRWPCLDAAHSKHTESTAQHSQPIPPAQKATRGLSPDALARLSIRRGAMHLRAALPEFCTFETNRKTATTLATNTTGPKSHTGSVPRSAHPPEHSSRCHAPLVVDRRGAMHPQAALLGFDTFDTYRKPGTTLATNTTSPQSHTGSVPRCTHPSEHSSWCHAPPGRGRYGAMHLRAALPELCTFETYRKTGTTLTTNTTGPKSHTGSVPQCTHPSEHSSRCHAPPGRGRHGAMHL